MTHSLAYLIAMVEEAGQFARSTLLRSRFELKPDGSVVTEADLEVERKLRVALKEYHPDATIWGEEFGFDAPNGKAIYLIDPIDGTSNYYSGNPLWGVSVALMGEMGLWRSCLSLPELGITLAAEYNEGAYWNGEKMTTPTIDAPRSHDLISVNDSVLSALGGIVQGKPRLCGAFVVDGAFTVSRWFKTLYGMNESLYDVAAVVLPARELGIPITYCDGTEWKEMDLLHPKRISKPWQIGLS